jgi:hypothetical protein
MAATASNAARRLVVGHSHANDSAPSVTPNTSALRVGTWCLGSGRDAVRFITASMSASATQLSALAEPAAMVPPNSVANTSHGDGMPRSASIIAGTVVTSRSSMILGLVSATYARTTSLRVRRGVSVVAPSAALTGGS